MIETILQAGAYGTVFLVGVGVGVLAAVLVFFACLFLDDKFLRSE